MARIWRVYEGNQPTRGEPLANIPAPEAVSLFDLRPEDFVAEPENSPRFGDVTHDLWYRGFKHIVVEIERHEARVSEWKPGFYRSRIKPEEAFIRLIRHPIEAELGKQYVVRVDSEPAIDSQGQDALKITVVLTPEATARLREGASLDTAVRLRKRLRDDMREDRTPIIRYATEAELTQDGGP